jgi:integrase
LTVDEAVYEGAFGTPKTSAGLRRVPLSGATVRLLAEGQERPKNTRPDALVFATWSGKPTSPNNVLRRWVFPACAALNLPNATWLTFRRTYVDSRQGGAGEGGRQLMGHTNADVTINIYTQLLDASVRTAVDRIGSELITIVHESETASERTS